MAVVALCAVLPAVAAADEEPRLTISIYDYANVDPATLTHARRSVVSAFAAVGVAVEWAERCARPECLHSQARSVPPAGQIAEMTVYIFTEERTPQQYAKMVMGAAPIGSYLAYAYFDRVRTFAFERDLFLGTVLGHVIAHEVGHLLLRQGHTALGLMRATWTSADLHAMQQGRLGFTPEQGAHIRAEVARLSARGAAYVLSSAGTVNR
jgi:hypothetical protein